MKDTSADAIKVVVFGEAGVGKSALTVRYVLREFQSTYQPTIEDSYPANVEVDGRPVKLELLDTAGHGVFSQMRESYIRSADGFVLVYSVTDEWSFHAMTTICEQIIRVKREKTSVRPPIVLVGNKCDLESDRRISYQDGVLLSKRFTCPFFETSAKDDIGVEDVFTELTRHVKRSRNTSRNTFSRDSRTRFSMRGLTISERKCKERLHALKKNERSTELRRTGSFRRFVCGAGALTQP
ncbi:ras-related protein Rap-2b [Nematostella vectensis]|uniref:ras-related protein Rap-2b n=1 Tax=Nematostella vectensis TaxID=45351 RepID=UPI00139015DA|nr:ras-related protein Rap-2b [Nematostella vectensis]